MAQKNSNFIERIKLLFNKSNNEPVDTKINYLKKMQDNPVLNGWVSKPVEEMEIDKLERKINKIFPKAYREFLLLGGEYSHCAPIQSAFSKLEETQKLAQFEFQALAEKIERPLWVIGEADNYEHIHFFYFDEGDDPPVYYFCQYLEADDEAGIEKISEKFSSYINNYIDHRLKEQIAEEKFKRLQQKFENELKEQIFEPKKDKLILLLVDFIENKAPRLISNPEDLKVLIFNTDRVFDFLYSGYPDPNFISKNHWLSQFTINIKEKEDVKRLKNIVANNKEFTKDCGVGDIFLANLIEKKQGMLWIGYWELEKLFFAECWQNAKKQTGSEYRCFFLEGEFTGIDADTGEDVNIINTVKILTEEGIKFKILK